MHIFISFTLNLLYVRRITIKIMRCNKRCSISIHFRCIFKYKKGKSIFKWSNTLKSAQLHHHYHHRHRRHKDSKKQQTSNWTLCFRWWRITTIQCASVVGLLTASQAGYLKNKSKHECICVCLRVIFLQSTNAGP